MTVDGLKSGYGSDDLGRVTAVTGAGHNQFEYSTDEPLPAAVVTPAAGRRAMTVDDGFTVSVTDPTGATSLTERDQLGNPVAVGFSPDTLWAYEFDGEGNITSSTSAMGRTWSATWGPRSTLLSERDPLDRTSSYAYDEAGIVARAATRRDDDLSIHVIGTSRRDDRADGDLRYEYAPTGRLATIVRPGDRSWRVATEVLDDAATRRPPSPPTDRRSSRPAIARGG